MSLFKVNNQEIRNVCKLMDNFHEICLQTHDKRWSGAATEVEYEWSAPMQVIQQLAFSFSIK